ncbi:MAG TPA: hypothetical protein VGD98_19630 [Ktedonobacteraceae bacterium]
MRNKSSFAERYPDLLAEQDEPALRQLVSDLETLYTSDPLPAHLKRSLESGRPIVLEQQPREPVQPLPGTLGQHIPRSYIRWSRLNTLAGALVAALLVGILIGTFSLLSFTRASHPNNGSIQRVLASPCVSSATPKLGVSFLQMSDASTGWASGTGSNGGNSQNELLHTDDGGCHWKIVTPQGFGPLTAVIQHISGQLFWGITGSDAENKAFFARTTDGGQNWRFAPVQTAGGHLTSAQIFQGSVFASFWSATEGQLLTVSYNSSTGHVANLALFHTSDGGLNWSQVVVDSATLPTHGAYYNGINFLNQTTGWLTATLDASAPGLFITHDAGRTWSQQSLPEPLRSVVSLKQLIVLPPHFFSTQEGVLTASSWAWPGIITYITHDAGATWQSTAFLRIPASPARPGFIIDIALPAPVPQFTGADFGWFWTGPLYEPANTLLITHNEGQNWTALSIPFAKDYHCSTADFISAHTGWLTCNQSGTHASAPSRLFQTSDGGKSWQPIEYTVA